MRTIHVMRSGRTYFIDGIFWGDDEEGATIPANGPYILCDDDVGAICGRFDINLTLLSMPKRLNRSAGRAENRPQASSEHTSPVATGNRRVVRLASQTDE